MPLAPCFPHTFHKNGDESRYLQAGELQAASTHLDFDDRIQLASAETIDVEVSDYALY